MGEAAVLDQLRLHAGAPPGSAWVQAALDRLVRAGLPFAQDGRQRRFDPGETLNFAKSLGLQGRDGFWAQHCVPAGRARVQAMPAGTQRVSVLLRRTVRLAGVPPGRRIRLRLPLPIEDAHVQQLAIQAAFEDATPLQMEQTPARLEAVLAAPDQASVAIRVQMAFTSIAGPAPEDTDDPAPYLRPHDGVIQVTPGVAALAAALAGPAPATAQAMAAFIGFMLDHLTCGTVQYGAIGAGPAVDWVLRSGWFDCYLGSALLASLCRAVGIPARLVGGLLLYPTAPAPHHWVEVLHGRIWRPADLLAWDLSAGGTDAAWRSCFQGQVDHRMRTERLPFLFTGASSLALPSERHLLITPSPDGIGISHLAARTGSLLYRDEVAVSLAPAGPT